MDTFLSKSKGVCELLQLQYAKHWSGWGAIKMAEILFSLFFSVEHQKARVAICLTPRQRIPLRADCCVTNPYQLGQKGLKQRDVKQNTQLGKSKVPGNVSWFSWCSGCRNEVPTSRAICLLIACPGEEGRKGAMTQNTRCFPPRQLPECGWDDMMQCRRHATSNISHQRQERLSGSR